MMAKKNIAIGGISTECSSYSPLFQNKEDFRTVRGQDLIGLVDFPFSEHNINVSPLFFNKSVPGGPIDREYFDQVKNQFIEEIKALGSYHTASQPQTQFNPYNVSVFVNCEPENTIS